MNNVTTARREATGEPASNPFATRFIRPGSIAYCFPAGISAETVVDQLAALRWCGAILGPHGSGKSSLLVALKPALAARGRQIVQQQLQGGEWSLRWAELRSDRWNSTTQVVIDGFEQLNSWQRLLLRARCRLSGAGLLVTAHRPVGIEPVYATKPSAELAQAVVRQLLPPADQHIGPADVATVFDQHQGNIRETLLALFDVYRARSHS
jgi:hypothetical protein